MAEAYRRVLQAPGLSDQQIEDMRKHVVQLAQTLCEHVWSKPFY